MSKALFPVYEMRPLPGSGECLRYANGAWIPDDGEWDLAFVRGGNGPPMAFYVDLNYQRNIVWKWLTTHWSASVAGHPDENAWHYSLREGETQWGGDWGREQHDNAYIGRKAMNKCCELYRCANGRGPGFLIGDPYIAAGLLRLRDSKELVRFPSEVTCHRCGETFAVSERGHIVHPEPTP